MRTASELSRRDGTITLLKTGLPLLGAGLLCIAVVELFLGGVFRHGPHGNVAWFLLICAGFVLPFGLLLSLLGGAKWLRNRRLARGA